MTTVALERVGFVYPDGTRALEGVSVELDWTDSTVNSIVVRDANGNALRIIKGEYSGMRAMIPAKVDVTELMGNEVFVYLTADSQPFVGRVDPRTSYHMGDRVQVALNMEHMHLFETEGDQRAVR